MGVIVIEVNAVTLRPTASSTVRTTLGVFPGGKPGMVRRSFITPFSETCSVALGVAAPKLITFADGPNTYFIDAVFSL